MRKERPRLQTHFLFLDSSFQFMNIYFIAPSEAMNGSINKTVSERKRKGSKVLMWINPVYPGASELRTLTKPCHSEVHHEKSHLLSLWDMSLIWQSKITRAVFLGFCALKQCRTNQEPYK